MNDDNEREADRLEWIRSRDWAAPPMKFGGRSRRPKTPAFAEAPASQHLRGLEPQGDL